MVRKLILFAESCFVVLGLMFFTGGIAVGGRDDDPTSGLVPMAIVQVVRYFVWFVSTLLLLLNGKRTLITIRRDWVLWLFVVITLASWSWSHLPEWTADTMREMIRTTIFGLYFATRFDLKQQVKFVAITFGIGMVASILLAIGLPAFGRHSTIHPGAWRGIYGDKNIFGGMMVIALLSFYALPIRYRRDRWIKWLGIGTAIALILLSTSKTALVLAFLLLVLLAFYQGFRWRGKISVVLTSLGVIVFGFASVVFLSTWTDIVQQLGRDPTLSGRSFIWLVSFRRILDRPFFGYGRSAFWAPDSPYPKEVNNYMSVFFRSPHAHNGYIDTALDVGLVGLILLLICLVSAFIIALKRAYRTDQPEYLWALGFLTYFALNNMTESFTLRLEYIFWVLFVATVLTIRQRVPITEDEPEPRPNALPYRSGSLQKGSA
jgi:O-antigen ligase